VLKVRKELKVFREPLEQQEVQLVHKVLKVLKGFKVRRVLIMQLKGLQVDKGLKDHRGLKDLQQ